MSLPQSVTVSKDAMARQVGDEMVILELTSGNYYGLDAIGTRVWQLLCEGQSPQQVCDALFSEYDVDRNALEQDVERLLADLSAKHLVLLS